MVMDRRVQGTHIWGPRDQGQLATLLRLEHNFLGWLIVIIRNPHVVVLVGQEHAHRAFVDHNVLPVPPKSIPYEALMANCCLFGVLKGLLWWRRWHRVALWFGVGAFLVELHGAERAGSSMLYRSGSRSFPLVCFLNEYAIGVPKASIPAANMFVVLFFLYFNIFFLVHAPTAETQKTGDRILFIDDGLYQRALGYMVRLSISATLLGYGFLRLALELLKFPHLYRWPAHKSSFRMVVRSQSML